MLFLDVSLLLLFRLPFLCHSGGLMAQVGRLPAYQPFWLPTPSACFDSTVILRESNRASQLKATLNQEGFIIFNSINFQVLATLSCFMICLKFLGFFLVPKNLVQLVRVSCRGNGDPIGRSHPRGAGGCLEVGSHASPTIGYRDVEPKIGVFYPPKWMVKIMENPIKIDDLGVPLFLETPHTDDYVFFFFSAGHLGETAFDAWHFRSQFRLPEDPKIRNPRWSHGYVLLSWH